MASMTKSQLRSFICICMLYIATAICSEVLLQKLVLFGTHVISAGSFVAPLWFILGDLMAELYGYKVSKNIFYCFMVCDFFFSLITTLMIHLPSPSAWHGQGGYQLVLGGLLRQYIAGVVGFMLGGLINLRLVTKWRTMMHGRYFWLRSIGASLIGELIFTTIAFLIILYGTHSTAEEYIISLIIFGTLCKLAGNIILAPLANIVVFYAQKQEPLDLLNESPHFNPFSKK